MLKLNAKENATVARLLKEWEYDAMADIEEDCCGTRSYHFEVIQSGIGDAVYLCFRGHREFISDVENL